MRTYLHICILGDIIIHMRVGVYFNTKYLSATDVYFDKISSVLGNDDICCTQVTALSQIEGLDVLIVLGGDGTILSVASECALHSVKIAGVNCGHMGFLADFELNQLCELLRIIRDGNYKTERRMMLRIDFSGKHYYALNDLVIQRSTSGNAFSNTISLHAEIDGTTVDNFSSDGLIISTPTGSTAYSLAAGGSILTPDLNAFILTPICPHSLHSRPIVFSSESTVKISQLDAKSALNLIVDGKACETFVGFDVITVQKAERYAEFITATDNNFFDKLLIKLNIWSK